MSDFPTFDLFYEDVFDRSPFPWQQNLANCVVAHEGVWPAHIDIPTGLGKTTTLIVAVWHLAYQAHQILTGDLAAEARVAPLRIIHAVDRRSIIDQTAENEHATLQQALDNAAPGSAAGQVRDALVRQFGASLQTQALHGQSLGGLGWLRDVATPRVVSTTTYQLVSRLMFRGFGVTERRAPIDAGLIGLDSLILLDEPHLSAAAAITIDRILAKQDESERIVTRSQMVLMGATVPKALTKDLTEGRSNWEKIGLTGADRKHPVVATRLAGKRPLMIVNVTTPSDSTLVKVLTAQAVRLAGEHQSVVVFCNTVRVAQDVKHALADDPDAPFPGDVLLVVGPMRGNDRRQIEARLLGGDLPRVVVATQTLEAGVDLDFDAMVTEACPWPVLVQRMARCNRRGTKAHCSVVLLDATTAGGLAVYSPPDSNNPISATIKHLTSRLVAPGEPLDMSLNGQARINPSEDMPAAIARPPELREGLLATMVCTRPSPQINVIPFIRGVEQLRSSTPDVQVMWRTHVNQDHLRTFKPHPRETLTIPLPALTAFMWGDTQTPFGDAGVMSTKDGSTPGARWLKQFSQQPLIRLPDGKWVPIQKRSDITPNSLVVLPVDAGGYDADGWNPPDPTAATRQPPVTDCAPTLDMLGDYTGWIEVPWTILNECGVFSGALDEAGEKADLDRLAGATIRAAAELPENTALQWLPVITHASEAIAVRVATRNDEKPGTRITLEAHQRQVGELTERNGLRVGLRSDLRELATYAGHHHDDGKFTKENQDYLGREEGDPAWAKSAAPRTRAADRQKKIAAGVVGRHEDDSGRHITQDHNYQKMNTDSQRTVAHLVESHHGYYRPFPCLEDYGPTPATAGLPDRFKYLNQKYGPWGLAYLEAHVRLADHAKSENPTEVDDMEEAAA